MRRLKARFNGEAKCGCSENRYVSDLPRALLGDADRRRPGLVRPGDADARDWEDPRGWAETAIAQCLSQPWTLLVLHDLPTGAMGRLRIFIDRVLDHGGRVRQDFPPACVPIRRGEVVGELAAYVTA